MKLIMLLFCLILIATKLLLVADESRASGALQSSIVVLLDKPTELTGSGTRLFFPTQTQVVGRLNLLCVVISNSPEFASSYDRRRIYNELLDGITLSGQVIKADGKRLTLSRTAYAWSLEGHVLKHGEISSCMAVCDDQEYAIGDPLSHAKIYASTKIRILGVFWESTNRYDH